MSQSERTEYILSLERQINRSRLDHAMSEARQKNRQDTISAGIGIVAAQMQMNTMSLFYMALRG